MPPRFGYLPDRMPDLSMPQSMKQFPSTAKMSLATLMSTSKSCSQPTGKKRHVVDVIRTIYWANQLAAASPDGRLAWFEPQLPQLRTRSAGNDEGSSRCGQLRAYERGLRVPNPAVVEALARFDRQSYTMFHHPLWTVLKWDVPMASIHVVRIDSATCRRDWDLFEQRILREPRDSVLSSKSRRGGWPMGIRADHTVLGLASLDLLVDQALTFRASMNAHNPDGLLHELSPPSLGPFVLVRCTLLALAPLMGAMGIAQPLADYFDDVAHSALGKSWLFDRLRLSGYFGAAVRGTRLIAHLEEIEGPLRAADRSLAAYWAAIQGGPLDLELSMADIRRLVRYRNTDKIGSVLREEYMSDLQDFKAQKPRLADKQRSWPR